MAHIRKYYTSKGDVRYSAEIRIKGSKPYSKTFHRMTDAKLWAQQSTEKTQRQTAGISTTRQYTLTEAIERYRIEYLPTIKRAAVKYVLNWWERELGEVYLSTITPADLIKFRTKLLNQPKLGRCKKTGHATVPLYNADGTPILRKPKTVQNYLDVLSVLYNKAILEWEWVDRNPVQRVKKLKINDERTRFLSDHNHLWPGEEKPRHWDSLPTQLKAEAVKKFPRAYELPRLIDALKSQQSLEKVQNNKPLWAYYLFVVQLGLGLRLSEATHMVWEENDVIEHPVVIVDMKRSVLLLKSTKQDTSPRLKPLCDEVMTVLNILYAERRYDCPLVFHSAVPHKPLRFDRRLQRAVREAGLQDFRWHDLRHTTASYLSMLGAGQREVMEALHHRSMKSSQRYQHLTCDHLRGLMNRLTNTVLEEKESPSRFEHTS
ncbi:tyrosine-type recombinase/integrase [Kordiimonas pumila]|uniref:Tyrosine-type recombinase/integrase n=1 Tax=Kordiimonas pumila TaxID=2161677 RepID=A0ABV7D5U3_9PROT|nr:site-specific integrase [Kordiimonas pumila]